MKTVFVYPEVFVGLKENIGSSANQANVLCATRFMGLTIQTFTSSNVLNYKSYIKRLNCRTPSLEVDT